MPIAPSALAGPEASSIAWSAQRRLHRTWTRLDARSRRRTIIADAAAREHAGSAGRSPKSNPGPLIPSAGSVAARHAWRERVPILGGRRAVPSISILSGLVVRSLAGCEEEEFDLDVGADVMV